MAFFRKKQNVVKGDSLESAKAVNIENQAKWDKLEQLISSKAGSPSLNTHAIEDKSELSSNATSSDSPDTKPDTFDAKKAEFGGHDLRTSDSAAFASELKVDLPNDSNYVDVTPEPAIMAPVTAMTASASIPKTREGEANATTQFSDSSFTPPPPALSRPDRADIGAMRLDVARISADIQSGEELYRRAQQRIENLTSFVERAEVDFSVLNRVEPENRRLKARNRTLEREISSNTQKIEVLRTDLKDREHRLTEKSRIYEVTLGKLSVVQKSLQEYERALNTTREGADRNALNSERLQTSLDVERRENEVLRERMTDVVSEMDNKQTAFIEAKKMADSLAQDCADFRHQAETAETDNADLRKALATSQTQNNAMKSELMSLHEDIRTFKTQSEFTIITREDEATALQQQVDQLSKQLNIKDEIIRSAARDVQELRKIRTAQDLERERLEATIQRQSFQLDEASTDLLQTKQDVSDFDRRYRDVATALSVSQARRMSNNPADTPDIAPDIQPHKSDDLDTLSTKDFEDRIADFRLGLRDDIS